MERGGCFGGVVVQLKRRNKAISGKGVRVCVAQEQRINTKYLKKIKEIKIINCKKAAPVAE